MGTELKKSDLAELAKIAKHESARGDKYAKEAKRLFVKALKCYRRCGAALSKIKDGLKHTEFGPWLKKNFGKSKETAQLYMRIDREWDKRLAAVVESGEVLTLRDARDFLIESNVEASSQRTNTKEPATGVVRGLNSVKSGLAAGDKGIERSDHFIFENDVLSTYNGFVACRISSPLDITGAVHRSLLDILSDIGTEKVEFVPNDKHQLVVQTKRGNKKAVLRIEPIAKRTDDDYEPPAQDAKWFKVPDPDDFSDAIKTVCPFTSKDFGKAPLHLVHLCPTYIEAFDDDTIACRYMVKTGVKEPVLADPLSLKPLANHDITGVHVAKKWIHFRSKSEGLVYSIIRGDSDEAYKNWEPYPNLDKLFSRDGEPLKISQGKKLREAAMRAEIFTKRNADDRNVLKIGLKHNKLTVTGKNEHGRYFARLKVSYSGQELVFGIVSKTLTDILKRKAEIRVGVSDDKPFLTAAADSLQIVATLNTF